MSISPSTLLHSRSSEARDTVAPVRSTTFDVGRFTRTAFGDHRAGIDLQHSASRPLPAQVIRSLRYLHDLERTTTDTLRRILATSTAREARFTAFLTTWAYDRYWFAAQMEAVLTLSGTPSPPSLDLGSSRRDRRAHRTDLICRYLDPIWTTLVGEPVTALHAVRGLASTSAEIVACNRTLERAEHPELREVLQPVLARKIIHRDFFEAEAQMRLDGDVGAQSLVRSLLTRGFHPLRAGHLPVAESHWFLRFIFSPHAKDQVVHVADSRIRRLPGMSDHGPLETVLSRERPIG